MKKILPWVFSIFFGLCAFAYIPHFSALIFAIGCILSLPIPKIRDFLALKGLYGKFKGVLLAAILFAGIMATPTDHKIQEPNEPARDVTSVDESEPSELGRPKKEEAEQKKGSEKPNEETSALEVEHDKSAHDEQPTEAPAETAEVKPVQEPGAVSDLEPTNDLPTEQSPEVQAEAKPEPKPERTIKGMASNTTVYVSSRSNTIHSVHDCGGMKNYREMTIEEADSRGYKYCPNCW